MAPNSSDASQLTFRHGRPSDTATLYSLVNAAFASDTTTQVWLTPARVEVFPRSLFESKATATDTVCLVATSPASGPDSNAAADGPADADDSDGHRIVGCCYIRHNDADRTASRAWLGTLAVDPTLHGRGLGRQLLAYAERYAVVEWGSRRMEMDVVSSRAELMAWYEKVGYRRTGSEKPFPYRKEGEVGEGMYREGLRLVDLGKDLGQEGV